jgi:iron complex transport system substrate-binding protein
MDDFYSALRKLAKVLNKEKRANEIISFLKFQNIPKIKTDKKVYVGAVAYKGLHGLTSTIGNFLPFKLAGVKNIVNSPSQVYVSEEFLYKVQPDIIFLDESGVRLIDFNKYKYLKAFKNHQVYGLLPYNNYMTNIGSAYLDAFYIAKVFGKNVDIDKKAKEIYTFLVGKNVYPQMKKYFGGFRKLY